MKDLRALFFQLFLFVSIYSWSDQIVSSVKVYTKNDADKATIEIVSTNEFSYRVFLVENPWRLVVDIDEPVESSTELQAIEGYGFVERLRSARQKDGALRVVADLTERVNYQNSYLKFSDSSAIKKYMLKLRLQKKDIVVSSNENVRSFVVAIDAGHGGRDSGAVGSMGTLEKDVTLEIARLLKNQIERDSRLESVMTRSSDKRLGLRTRVKRARTKKADLFVSIHADAINNRKAKGSSVYVLSNVGASSEVAMRLARNANRSDFIGSIKRDDKELDLWKTLVDLSQRATIEGSREAGKKILFRLSKIGNVHKRSVQSAGFLVLKALDIPSVLIETAFISNPAEEKKLRNPNFRLKLAKAIYLGICDYFEIEAISESDLLKKWTETHKVKRGETLSALAIKYDTTVALLKFKNKLSSNAIYVGQKLQVPM